MRLVAHQGVPRFVLRSLLSMQEIAGCDREVSAGGRSGAIFHYMRCPHRFLASDDSDVHTIYSISYLRIPGARRAEGESGDVNWFLASGYLPASHRATLDHSCRPGPLLENTAGIHGPSPANPVFR